jgi:phage shock protein C
MVPMMPMIPMIRPLRLVRDPDGVIGGVCSGLAKAFAIDTSLLRIILIVSTLLLGTGAGLYLLLWIALPRADRVDRAMDRRLLGVCAQIAGRFETEVGLVRFLVLLSFLVSFGVTFFVYVLLYFLLPTPHASPQPRA